MQLGSSSHATKLDRSRLVHCVMAPTVMTMLTSTDVKLYVSCVALTVRDAMVDFMTIHIAGMFDLSGVHRLCVCALRGNLIVKMCTTGTSA